MITIGIVTLSTVGLVALLHHQSKVRRHRAFVRRLYSQFD